MKQEVAVADRLTYEDRGRLVRVGGTGVDRHSVEERYQASESSDHRGRDGKRSEACAPPCTCIAGSGSQATGVAFGHRTKTLTSSQRPVPG